MKAKKKNFPYKHERLNKGIRAIYTAFNILTAIITVLAAYGGKVNPDTSTIPALLAMTFPAWMALTLLLTIINLIFFRKTAIIGGVTFFLCLGPFLSVCPLNVSTDKLTPDEEKRSFTLLSYNVYGLNDYRDPISPKDISTLQEECKAGKSNPTMSHIIQQDADILCLQEFYLNFALNSPVFSREMCDTIITMYPHRVSGINSAILSKYPLYPVKLRQPDSHTGGWVGAIANIQGHRTLIISVHLESIGLDNNDKELYHELTKGGDGTTFSEVRHQLLSKLSRAFRKRAEQARELRQQIDSIGIRNVIVAGDFNDIPDCYAMRTIAGNDFRSSFATAGFGPKITYHANRFYFHIDHILFRGQLKATSFGVDTYNRSDHYAIDTRFIWDKDAETTSTQL